MIATFPDAPPAESSSRRRPRPLRKRRSRVTRWRPTTPWRVRSGTGSAAPLPQLVLELWDLVITYVKQETVVPLKQLGRYVAFGRRRLAAARDRRGVPGVVGALRRCRPRPATTFTGDWSWVPYVIVFAALLIGALIIWKARGPERVRRPT